MNTATGRDSFITFTPANFRSDMPSRCASNTGSTGRRHESAEKGSGELDQQVPAGARAAFANLETLKGVLGVLNEGGMDVVGFLDALWWGN